MIDKQKIKIASRYSGALIEFSKEKNLLDVMSKDVSALKEGILKSPLAGFLQNKNISKEDKRNTTEEIFKNKINKYLINFLDILIDENRIDTLETIIYCFEEKLDEINNIEKVTVLSAVSLDISTKERISRALEKKLNKKIEIREEVDEKIISGLVIKIKDRVLDLSLKNKFDNLLKEIV